MKKPILIIAGPTACGKTDISINLAKQINGEIISADSMQIYKYMDIGTAKIKESEMQGIKHYLIDEFYPNEPFSIAKFKALAKEYISKIHKNGKIPILVGGTGFYINSVIYDNDFSECNADDRYRKNLEKIVIENGNEFLHNMLKEVDFQAFQKIHKNNVKKIIRALEYFYQTGNKISEHNEREKLREKAYNTTFFVLNMDRKKLYQRIDERVDLMFSKGLLEEVKFILEKGYDKSLVSMQGLGYKEIIKYLEGEISIEEARYLIKRDTRRFAKRQITWFKNQYEGSIWIEVDKFNKMESIIEKMKEDIRV